jgi:hypothetical protein
MVGWLIFGPAVCTSLSGMLPPALPGQRREITVFTCQFGSSLLRGARALLAIAARAEVRCGRGVVLLTRAARFAARWFVVLDLGSDLSFIYYDPRFLTENQSCVHSAQGWSYLPVLVPRVLG